MNAARRRLSSFDVDAPADLDLLLAASLVPLLDAPRSSEEAAAAMAVHGVEITAERAEELLLRLSELGLARPVTERDGDAAYVATSLGRRLTGSLVTGDSQLALGLEELERLRSDLLATIGHELRTPLTSIRTSVGLLLDPGLAPNADQRQQLLVTIARSADRMQRLVADLLDFARLRSGGVEMRIGRFDARDVARDAVQAIEPLVTARRQTFEVEIPDEPIPVAGDRRRLEQALLNLLSNAQKYTDTGGRFGLRLTATDDDVAWTVDDEGPGIGLDEQARLFERFFVGAGDRGGRGGGIGLGLPTALAIAQAHGGRIDVESEVGRGSTFTLAIPRERG